MSNSPDLTLVHGFSLELCSEELVKETNLTSITIKIQVMDATYLTVIDGVILIMMKTTIASHLVSNTLTTTL